ncbi:MAG: hypothetical protein NTV51_08705 [Verrucomicrobia bacterium]|nr:hypothetical protein [Verrucomicrobiota bacterium]
MRLADPVFSVTMANGTPVMLTVGAPAAKGPPTRAESAAWDRALADYLKTRAAAPAAASPVSGTTGAPGAGLELVGVLDTPEGRTFLIKDAVGGAPQKVRLGESVGRYVLTEYQAKDEMLMLRDGDATQRVKLREAKVVAPLATETEIAFQLIQEIQRREGWAVAAMRVQQPQRMDDGNWLVGAMQVLEQNERGLVGGDRISGIVSKEGKLISYTNRGRAQ